MLFWYISILCNVEIKVNIFLQILSILYDYKLSNPWVFFNAVCFETIFIVLYQKLLLYLTKLFSNSPCLLSSLGSATYHLISASLTIILDSTCSWDWCHLSFCSWFIKLSMVLISINLVRVSLYLWLNIIPLCIWRQFQKFIISHSALGGFYSWPLQMVLRWTWAYRGLFEMVISFPLNIYPAARLWDHIITYMFTILRNVYMISDYNIYINYISYQHNISFFLKIAFLVGGKVASYCTFGLHFNS